MLFLRLLAAVACVLGLVVPGIAAASPARAAAAAAPSAGSSAAAEQATSAPRPAGAEDATGVVVIGAPGLTLSDLTPEGTPHLWSLVEDGASANLAVRTLTPATCAAAGWLSFGAGDRMHSVDLTPDWFSPLLAHTSCPRMIDPFPVTDAAAPETDDPDADSPSVTADVGDDPDVPAGTPVEAGPAVFEDFERVTAANAGSGYGADPGAFTRAAEGADWCTAAYGRGAAYAASDEDGHVTTWAPTTSLISDPTGTSATGADEPILDACPLTLIDAGTAADPTWEPNAWHAWNDESLGRTRTGQIAALDARVGRILEQTPESSDVVVAGLGDADYPSRLRALIAAGPSYGPGTLRSSSTRQAGLVQLTDVLPATIAQVGLESEGSSPARFIVDPSTDAHARMDDLVADSRKAATVHTHAQTFSILLDVLHYALTLALAVLLLVPVVRTLRTKAPRTLTALRTYGAWAVFTVGLLPMASFVATALPWGRLPTPGWGLAGAIALGVLALLAVSVAGPWRRTWQGRVAAVSLVSAVILVVDVALGSRLQFNALMGYNPIVAGRFYGLGNQGAALFLAAALLGLGIVAARLIDAGRVLGARLLVASFAVVSVLVLGNPAWGAKFGGTVAALVGFTVLLLALFRIRVSIVRLVLIGTASLAIIVGVAGLDYLRPPAERSHFGNFFGQMLDGQLIDVVSRKLESNLRIIVINPALAIVVPLAVFTVLFSLAYLQRFDTTRMLARPWANTLPPALSHPTVHAGFLAAAIALGVGLVITDSGVAVPATGAMMLVPMLVVMSIGIDREKALR
ncbi:MAG TPA: hypothetical protein VK065_06840 [Brevibacterium sp.]|nr:hypothetical protein [Brevibacterium sp.]